MKRLRRTDATGKRLKIGDEVRIVGVPDLSGMSPECQAESGPVFEYLVGKYKRIREFDEFGFAWVSFTIRNGPNAGMHSVALEPYLLKLRQTQV